MMIMLDRAFLFDVDGVLVASHELQAEALYYSMNKIAKKYKLFFQPSSEINAKLLELLVGGSEDTTIKSVLELFPVFLEHHVELFKSAWEKYYELAAETDSFKIKESVNLLNVLREIGYKVCLVSNLRQKDIERYCKILGLNEIIQTGSYVCFEDCNGQTKPSPLPYITAAQKLQVLPSNCIVFEDSENGIISAKRAGMYVVGLHRYTFPETLSHKGADEVVNNVFQAKILAKVMYELADISLQFNNLVMRIVTIQKIDKNTQESIINSTYEIYKTLFNGRSLDTWRDKLIDNKDMLTRVGLFYANQKLVGYGVLKFKDVLYNGEQRTVSLGSVGLLEGFRGANILLRYYQIEFRRFLMAFFNKPNHMIDNFLSYGGYNLALRLFNNLYPSLANLTMDQELSDYSKFLANYVGYARANVDNPWIYRSTSRVIETPQAKERALAATDPNCKYFIAQIGIGKGHGLLAIAPVTIYNLCPIEQATFRPISINNTSQYITFFNSISAINIGQNTNKPNGNDQTGEHSIRAKL